MSLRHRAAILAGAAALAFGPAVLLASPAAAAPTGCTTQYGAGSASSFCSSGTGMHQVVVLQKHASPLAGPILVVGPCVPVGQTSHTSITPWPVVSIRANTCG
ncbi:hypothetical protein ACBI99_24500 [Nonomuraea sp. ATR24]|uniref:hypothetical protein n=1 Tax=Nonomuraea TaxID=83681 RepID=UPI001C5F9A68|nr:hypothetical protein [Nonomuraea ceibae]